MGIRDFASKDLGFLVEASLELVTFLHPSPSKVEAALLEVDPAASKIETAHFALGCFWGGE